MNFAYSEDQQALQELAQKIIGDLSTHERLNEVEKTEDGIDKELWAELAIHVRRKRRIQGIWCLLLITP